MITRREILKFGGSLLALPYCKLLAKENTSNSATLPLIQRKIPSTGELLPVIGMGTSRTFNTDDNPESLAKLTAVIEARAKATSMTIDPSNLTPENMAQFQGAQDQLSGALSRLLVTIERYPDLNDDVYCPYCSLNS